MAIFVNPKYRKFSAVTALSAHHPSTRAKTHTAESEGKKQSFSSQLV